MQNKHTHKRIATCGDIQRNLHLANHSQPTAHLQPNSNLRPNSNLKTNSNARLHTEMHAQQQNKRYTTPRQNQTSQDRSYNHASQYRNQTNQSNFEVGEQSAKGTPHRKLHQREIFKRRLKTDILDYEEVQLESAEKTIKNIKIPQLNPNPLKIRQQLQSDSFNTPRDQPSNHFVRTRTKTIKSPLEPASRDEERFMSISRSIEVAADQPKQSISSFQLAVTSNREQTNSDVEVNEKIVSVDYEKELENITNEFIQEWDKMAKQKQKVYGNFRFKLASEYPRLRQHYTEVKLIEENNNSKQETLSMMLNSSEAYERPGGFIMNFDPVDPRVPTSETKRNKKMLREMFQKAYFWSRTKNKFICNSVSQEEERQEVIESTKMQKNLTFQSYISTKQGKHVFANRKQPRGKNIIRNKEEILAIEREGSEQQAFLKKCLDDAIEDFLRSRRL